MSDLQMKDFPPDALVDTRPSVADRLSQYETTKRELTWLSAEELMTQPDPSYLIDGIIERSALTVLYGGPGSGKTFVALDMALHVAFGRPWCGRGVQHGSVIYVAAEGSQSLGRRLRAWLHYYDLRAPINIGFIPEALELTGGKETLAKFMNDGARKLPLTEDIFDYDGDHVKSIPLPPCELVVFDTFARCALGADENDAQQMGKVVQWLDLLRDRRITDVAPTVLVIHHSGKYTNLERGSTALRGASDTMLALKSDGYGPVLSCSKQKNDEAFDQIPLLIHRDKQGQALIVPRDILKSPLPAPHNVLEPIFLGPRQRSVLTIIANAASAGLDITAGGITKQSITAGEVAPASIYQALKNLTKKGLITKTHQDFYILTASGANWILEHKGEPELASTPDEP